jgi:hypothetical protein
MLPSFAVCLLATGVIGWLAWLFAPSGYVKLYFMSLAGAVWLVQGLRWAYRFFGVNYRMTNRRLFLQRGVLRPVDEQVDLASIGQVVLKARWHEKLAGTGQVLIFRETFLQTPLVLDGVKQPARVAEDIRVWARRAREQATARVTD